MAHAGAVFYSVECQHRQPSGVHLHVRAVQSAAGVVVSGSPPYGQMLASGYVYEFCHGD